MSNELRAAADSLRYLVPVLVKIGVKEVQSTGPDTLRALLLVAHAYLAEHPVDDAEPLTDAVFERLGFAILDRGFVVARYKHADIHSRTLIIEACVDGQWFLSTSGGMSGSFATIPPCHTVGEWRQLCERLGISPKEGE